jgi:hypothetical protein
MQCQQKTRNEFCTFYKRLTIGRFERIILNPSILELGDVHMAVCKQCGKRGLFLKVREGLCPKCLDAQSRSLCASFACEQTSITPSIVPDEPIKTNDEHVHMDSVVDIDGQLIEKQYLPDVFQWDGIRRIDKNFYILTSSENIQTATNAIMKLNSFLDEASIICKTIPNLRFDESQLNFKYDPTAYTLNQCTLSFSSRAPKGKPPKLIIDLVVFQNERIRGRIAFDKEGKICHAEVSASIVKREEYPNRIIQTVTAHTVICTTQDGVLKIRLIYRIDGGYRNKVYDSKEA